MSPSHLRVERSTTEEEREYYSLSAQVYARFAPFYDVVAMPLKPYRREVVRLSGTGAGARVIDVATGTGAQAQAFTAVCGEVVGVDLSEAMLRVARRKNRSRNLRFVRCDAVELPFDDASFDIACVSFALHEMPRSVREAVVKEMTRVTEPNGTIVVVDYGLPRNALSRFLVFHVVHLFEREHYADFIHSDLPALLETAGIVVRDQRSLLFGVERLFIGTNRGDAVRTASTT